MLKAFVYKTVLNVIIVRLIFARTKIRSVNVILFVVLLLFVHTIFGAQSSHSNRNDDGEFCEILFSFVVLHKVKVSKESELNWLQ